MCDVNGSQDPSDVRTEQYVVCEETADRRSVADLLNQENHFECVSSTHTGAL
jgi:hypothetical protein